MAFCHIAAGLLQQHPTRIIVNLPKTGIDVERHYINRWDRDVPQPQGLTMMHVLVKKNDAAQYQRAIRTMFWDAMCRNDRGLVNRDGLTEFMMETKDSLDKNVYFTQIVYEDADETLKDIGDSDKQEDPGSDRDKFEYYYGDEDGDPLLRFVNCVDSFNMSIPTEQLNIHGTDSTKLWKANGCLSLPEMDPKTSKYMYERTVQVPPVKKPDPDAKVPVVKKPDSATVGVMTRKRKAEAELARKRKAEDEAEAELEASKRKAEEASKPPHIPLGRIVRARIEARRLAAEAEASKRKAELEASKPPYTSLGRIIRERLAEAKLLAQKIP